MKYDYYYQLLESFYQRRKRWIWAALAVLLLVSLAQYGKKRSAPKDPFRARIESQLSSYDGSHKQLEAHIKASLKNPGSYQHVSTSYIMPADSSFRSAVFTTTFKAENEFGAMVTKAVRARCDIQTGKVEAILPD